MAIDAVDLTLGCPPSRTVLTVTDCLALDTVQSVDVSKEWYTAKNTEHEPGHNDKDGDTAVHIPHLLSHMVCCIPASSDSSSDCTRSSFQSLSLGVRMEEGTFMPVSFPHKLSAAD